MREAEVCWPRLYDALVRVEGVAPEDSGVLAFGLENGGIFVERGRICWAAARGMQRRLRDLIGVTVAARGVDIDRLFERCRSQGSVLGETLVAEGLLSEAELERALRRHSAESLSALCYDETPQLTWTSRGGRGYAPRFTFRPVDVLLDIVGLYAPDLQEVATSALAPLVAADRRGAAFCVTDEALTVPVAVFGEHSVASLTALGRWASTIPLATRELGATPSFTLAATASGATTAVWWRDELLYAVVCDDRHGVAALAAHHLTQMKA